MLQLLLIISGLFLFLLFLTYFVRVLKRSRKKRERKKNNSNQIMSLEMQLMHSYKTQNFTKCFELIGKIEGLNKTSVLKDKVKNDLQEKIKKENQKQVACTNFKVPSSLLKSAQHNINSTK